MSRGRPLRLSPSVIEEIAEGVGAGLTVERAAARARVPYTTLASWQQTGRELRREGRAPRTDRERLCLRLLDAADEARAELQAGLLSPLHEAAHWRRGTGPDAREGEPTHWRAAAWLLDRLDRVGGPVLLPDPDERLSASESEEERATRDVIDAEEIAEEPGSEADLLRSRLATLRRRVRLAETSGNAAAYAALTRQITHAEDRLLALRPDAAVSDPAALDREAFVDQLHAAAMSMPVRDLGVFVAAWLERHRLAVDLRTFAAEWATFADARGT